PLFESETLVAKRQRIAECDQSTAEVFGRVGFRYSVVKMDFDLAPSGMAVLCQHLDEARIVMLCRIEVGVYEWFAIVIAPSVNYLRIFAAPPFQATDLFASLNPRHSAERTDVRLEVIDKREDQVYGARQRSARKPLPHKAWQDLGRVQRLFRPVHRIARVSKGAHFMSTAQSISRVNLDSRTRLS